MSHYENSVSSNEYEVEAIQNDRKKRVYDKRKRKWFFITEYYIKWAGYKKRTWEPEENLVNCGLLLKNYKKNKNKNSNSMNNSHNIYNKHNTNIKNSSRTPIKFVTSKRKEINYNNSNKKTKEKNKEINNKKINDDESYENNTYNINSYKPIYSDEEENKFTPMSSMNNLNHSFYSNEHFKLDNDSYTTFLKKSDIKKKKGINFINNTDNNYTNLLSSSNDYDDNNENNNENTNENNINNNNENNGIDVSEFLHKFSQERERSKERGKSIRINLLQRKRKLIDDSFEENSEHKEDSDISISIDDPFIKMEKDSFSFNNTNDNSNSNSYNNISINNNNLKKENLELFAIKVSDNENDPINFYWRDKYKNEIYFCTRENTDLLTKEKVIDYYENILKKYLKGRTLEIN